MPSKEDDLRSLGLRIKALREAKGWTQLDLAAALNKEQQTIQRIEAGKTNPTFLTLKGLASALGVSLCDITSEQ